MKEQEQNQIQWKAEVKSWIVIITISLLISFLISMVAKPTIVSGDSMNENYQDGDMLFVNKTSYWFSEPSRGDVIVFHSPHTEHDILIKRIIATEGEQVEIKDGKVYVNGELLKEDYITEVTPGNVNVTVPKDSLFVMGDNRDDSLDSRFIEVGFVSKEQIIGKATVRIFPFNAIGKAN